MYDLRETTIASYHEALISKETTVLETVERYRQRCAAIDGTLRSLICINPEAEAAAKMLDATLQHILANHDSGVKVKLPQLFGVPIVVKDSYTTKKMPTTIGCVTLKDFRSENGKIFPP